MPARAPYQVIEMWKKKNSEHIVYKNCLKCNTLECNHAFWGKDPPPIESLHTLISQLTPLLVKSLEANNKQDNKERYKLTNLHERNYMLLAPVADPTET